jgi:hypothetical protein
MPPVDKKQPEHVTTEKAIVTYRMPVELSRWVTHESTSRGLSANVFVVNVLNDLMTLYGLQAPQMEPLEADRTALKLDRRNYLLHLLLEREKEVRARGPGFDRWVNPNETTPGKK